MESLKEYPAIINPVFAATFNQMFGEPLPKKVTKDKPESKEKEKKGGKDEKV